jgi:hypothetical protein
MTRIPDARVVTLDVEAACDLCVESWRLGHYTEHSLRAYDAAIVRRTLRSLGVALETMGLGVLDYAGRQYDPGMAPEVVEIRADPTLPPEVCIVEETIEPTVTLHGKVILPGQIAVKRAGVVPSDQTRAAE